MYVHAYVFKFINNVGRKRERVQTKKRIKQDTGKTRTRTIIDKDKNKTKPRKSITKTETNQSYFYLSLMYNKNSAWNSSSTLALNYC